MNDLEKIDLIRERINVTFEQARNALQETEGDVVEALVYLEKEVVEEEVETDGENIYRVKGQELVDKIKAVIKEGNVNKINVKNRGKTLVEIPVTAGVISLILFPYLGILAGLAAMYKDYTLEIIRDNRGEKQGDRQHF